MAKTEDPKQPSIKYLSVTQVQGTRLRGRPVNTWNEILRKDMVDCGVTEDMSVKITHKVNLGRYW